MRLSQRSPLIWIVCLLAAATAACSSAASGEVLSPQGQSMEYDIVTLLPKDAIPSIDRPEFYSAEEADAEYGPQEIVLGVAFNGDARAYSVGLLSSHEIVNDTVAGKPIAVTW